MQPAQLLVFDCSICKYQHCLTGLTLLLYTITGSI